MNRSNRASQLSLIQENHCTYVDYVCVLCVRYKQEKRRQYEQRVCEIEHAIFTTLVMSATGGMGRAATTFYKRLASMISEKRNTEYSNSQTVNWIRCKLSFALLRALIMSIRRARSSRHHAASETTQGPIDLQPMEGQIY